jgi:hypothetical protein
MKTVNFPGKVLLFYFVLILLTYNKNRIEIVDYHKVFGCGYKTFKKVIHRAPGGKGIPLHLV